MLVLLPVFREMRNKEVRKTRPTQQEGRIYGPHDSSMLLLERGSRPAFGVRLTNFIDPTAFMGDCDRSRWRMGVGGLKRRTALVRDLELSC